MLSIVFTMGFLQRSDVLAYICTCLSVCLSPSLLVKSDIYRRETPGLSLSFCLSLIWSAYEVDCVLRTNNLLARSCFSPSCSYSSSCPGLSFSSARYYVTESLKPVSFLPFFPFFFFLFFFFLFFFVCFVSLQWAAADDASSFENPELRTNVFSFKPELGLFFFVHSTSFFPSSSKLM